MGNLRIVELSRRLCDSNLDRLSLEKTSHLHKSKDDNIGLPGVDFNDTIFFGIRVECVLDVAFTDNTQMSDDFESSTPKHMIFIIWQRL